METSMLLHCGCSSLFFSSNLHCTFFFQRICRPRPRCCQRSKERKAAGAAETPPTGQKQWRLAGNRRDLTWLMEHYAKRRICIGDKPPWLQKWRLTSMNEKKREKHPWRDLFDVRTWRRRIERKPSNKKRRRDLAEIWLIFQHKVWCNQIWQPTVESEWSKNFSVPTSQPCVGASYFDLQWFAPMFTSSRYLIWSYKGSRDWRILAQQDRVCVPKKTSCDDLHFEVGNIHQYSMFLISNLGAATVDWNVWTFVKMSEHVWTKMYWTMVDL